jgi:hypothetical protein
MEERWQNESISFPGSKARPPEYEDMMVTIMWPTRLIGFVKAETSHTNTREGSWNLLGRAS